MCQPASLERGGQEVGQGKVRAGFARTVSDVGGRGCCYGRRVVASSSAAAAASQQQQLLLF